MIYFYIFCNDSFGVRMICPATVVAVSVFRSELIDATVLKDFVI